MQYEVEINGRLRQVTVDRVNGRFAVAVDRRQWMIDVARVDVQLDQSSLEADRRLERRLGDVGVGGDDLELRLARRVKDVGWQCVWGQADIGERSGLVPVAAKRLARRRGYISMHQPTHRAAW